MWTRALFSVSLAASVGACASGPAAEENLNAPQACIAIDNTQGGGTAGRVILISDSRERIRIGNATMGRVLDYCFRRSNFSGSWYLLIEEVASDRLDPADRLDTATNLLRDVQERSQSFYINPGDRVIWNVHLDRITVERIGG